MKKILVLIGTILLFTGFKKGDYPIIWNGEYTKEYPLPSYSDKGFVSVRCRDKGKEHVFPLTPIQYQKLQDTLQWAQSQYPKSMVGVEINMELLGRISKKAKDLSEDQKVKLNDHIETNQDPLFRKVVRKDGNKIIPI